MGRASNGHQWRKAKTRIKTRDTHCHLCGQPIDKTLPAGHPMSFEVDHIIPLARGGPEYDLNNLAGTHRLCNQKKGDGTRKPKPIPQPAKPSQDWTQ